MNDFLLYEFTKLMKKKKWNLKELAFNADIHYSDMSRIFNNKKALSLHYLDAITEAFDLPKGSFYKGYVKLCFNERNLLDKRRSDAFVYECAKNGFKSELSYILSVMIEEKSKAIRTKYFQNLFFTAEQLFLEGKEKEALPLYELIIEHMPNTATEEVAISYFRKFYMTRLTNEGSLVLVRVLEYISYMPPKFQELTILWITATYYMLKQWDEVLHYAKRLEKIAKIEDHLGRALMYQAFALTRLGNNLDEVLNLIDRYEEINDYYADLAAGNRYVAQIDFGDVQVVDSYFNWLRSRDDFYVGIPRILESYVKLGRLKDAENFIEDHHDQIVEMSNSTNLLKQHLYLDYCYALGVLKCETNQINEGLDEILNVALKVKNSEIHERFQKCLIAIWHYRDFLSKELEEKYIRILS
ncbi:helix-turn-helix domain-containing protein [Gottfriedia sp. NPDC056225]|uniref:helix-turn-helix domain-containing protein n=1 Tax=Gottfriedia sp. NPDC056225 TaxID=3345751 RepID=UPI0035E1CEA1